MQKTTHYYGLSLNDVEESRRRYGANILTPPKKKSIFLQLLEKFKEPLIIVLLIAGILSIGISFYEYYVIPDTKATVFFEPVGIFTAIILATVVAFVFELKAEKEFSILNQVNDDEPVQVIRNGNATIIPKKAVVVGDIVILSPGSDIPADGQLLEAVSLVVDESSLTGEPICTKTTDTKHFDKEATFKSDYVMRGTKVMEGHGIFRVTAVGDFTENGKVYEASKIDDNVKTPLAEQLSRLGRLIAIISYTIAILVVIGRIWMWLLPILSGTEDFHWFNFLSYLLNTFMIAVTLIVVSVPEGLPMAVNLSLAYSMRRMLRTNNLVRKIHACETMGATTVICTDKTGTLTQNRMTVTDVNFFISENSKGTKNTERIPIESIALNSTARLDLSDTLHPAIIGNPTEGALLIWLRNLGVNYESIRGSAEILKELPFSTERKYMATVTKSDDGIIRLYVKGAPEIILTLCKSIAGNVTHEEIGRILHEYQKKAMRTIGFAYQELSSEESAISKNGIVSQNMEFIGIAAITDPVREEVPSAISEVIDAGIKVKIVTGDTTDTAIEIGRQIGLWDNTIDNENNTITGQEFAALSDSDLEHRIDAIKIISRARPLDKKRLVETLQRLGEIVAVTGDGTNDAPALKSAHVGLSMGDGTSVAKEASDITIIDNSFKSIGRAVMWGRSLYKNIQRFILFQLTVNVAACLTVLVGAFTGTESPLTVTQMLWVNLIMDTFAAVALASLPPSNSVMKEKPRNRKNFIISANMWKSISGIGGTFFIILLGLMYIFHHSTITSFLQIFHPTFGSYHKFSDYNLTIFFTTFVMLQFWNLLNVKSFESDTTAFRLKDCKGFILILTLILVGQILIVSFGGSLFNVISLKISDWIWIILTTSLVLWSKELTHIIRKTQERCEKSNE